MGCDIHFYVERRDNPNTSWTSADTFKTEGTGEDAYTSNYDNAFYSGRNYSLFAILADVRNGRGFAGVKTGVGFNPISSPRGLPDDITPETQAVCTQWDGDGHSHSWLTLKELIEYDWTQVTTLYGQVALPELIRWGMWGAPKDWSSFGGGAGITEHDGAASFAAIKAAFAAYNSARRGAHDEELFPQHLMDLRRGFGAFPPHRDKVPDRLLPEYELAIQALGLDPDARPVFRVTWDKPYYACASEFLSATIPRLHRLGAPENVRIVFFFDN